MPANETAYRVWGLSPEDKRKLVACLCQCPSIRNAEARSTLLNQLPASIAGKISEHAQLKIHVQNIVDTCLEYVGGIEHLIDVVLDFDEGTDDAANLTEVLQSISPRSVSWADIAELKSLFKSVFTLPKDEELLGICRDCLPYHHIPLPAKDPERSVLTCLLDWLSQKGRLESGEFPMLEFVTRLMPFIKKPDIQNNLKNWVSTLGEKMGLTREEISGLGKDKSADSAEPLSENLYLLVKVKPDSANKYTLEAWLFNGQDVIKNVYADDTRKLGKDEVATVVDDIVEAIHDYLLAAKNRLTIEFFLPAELLNHDIEGWTTEEDEPPIGYDYRVVIRSLDRLERKKWLRRCCRYWCGDMLKNPAENCAAPIHNIEENWCASLNSGLILCIFEFPPEQGFLVKIIQRGAPIALWPRKKNPRENFQGYLLNRKLEEVPELLRLNRRNIWHESKKKHLGYISLLWDDPDRQPPERRLEEPL